MTIIGSLAVSVLMAMKNEYLIYENIFKGIHDDENNATLWRATIFSSFLPLVLCSDVSDCHKPLSVSMRPLVRHKAHT